VKGGHRRKAPGGGRRMADLKGSVWRVGNGIREGKYVDLGTNSSDSRKERTQGRMDVPGSWCQHMPLGAIETVLKKGWGKGYYQRTAGRGGKEIGTQTGLGCLCGSGKKIWGWLKMLNAVASELEKRP